MFYERLVGLCEERGEKVTPVLKKLEISSSATGRWQEGVLPNGEKLIQLVKYFGVSADYFLGLIDEKRGIKMSNIQNLTFGEVSEFLRDVRSKRTLNDNKQLSNFCKDIGISLRYWLSLEFSFLKRAGMQFEGGVEEVNKVLIKTLEEALDAEKEIERANLQIKIEKLKENFSENANLNEKEIFQKITSFAVNGANNAVTVQIGNITNSPQSNSGFINGEGGVLSQDENDLLRIYKSLDYEQRMELSQTALRFKKEKEGRIL